MIEFIASHSSIITACLQALLVLVGAFQVRSVSSSNTDNSKK